jgi:hypothetical protein
MNQFVLSTPLGERYATLVDLPLTGAGEQMLIGALRDGFAVSYERNGTTDEGLPEASPVATKPRRVVKPGKHGRKAKSAEPAAPVAIPMPDVGDSVYLAWSQLPEKQRLQLSSVRTTKGAVAETRQGRRPIGVRFNGDPELVWLERVELARVPEVG